MHHSDSTGESPGSRKMAHPSVFTGRRGSNTARDGGIPPAPNCGAVPPDDHQASMMMHHPAPAGSSSPGPHHPPHSLNIHSQTQPVQSVGAQVKKKSGFQITSVLPAQVSASANNSIADDTESYDDMDESHTEDLSSSDILDVSVSRATDTGIPERSSSEETLNSLHGGETPGVVSPNEPVMHHPQQGYMVNGVHHHGHHHHSHSQHHKDQGTRSGGVGQPVAAQGRSASLASAGSVAPTQAGSVVQGQVPSGRSVQSAIMEGGGTGAVSQTSASGLVTGVGTALTGSVVGTTGHAGGAMAATTVAPVQAPPPTTTVTQTQPTAASTTTASRFRVVKLDSNSEPFRKGRWTCTEYYEKDAPSVDTAPAHRTVESIIHSENESTSGSSSGSTISGGGDLGPQAVQQTYGTPSGPAPHAGVTPQLHVHPQDPGAHPILHPAVVSSINSQALTVTGMLGTESSPAPVRPQQPVTYSIEGQVPQSSYPTNAKPPVSVSQSGMQSMEYSQIPQNIQTTAQPLHIPPIQGGVPLRAAPVPIGIPGLSVATPVGVPQPVSPKPQVPPPQMGIPQGSTISQAQVHPDQQQAGGQHSASSTSGQAGSSMPSSATQSNLQPGPQSILHGGAIPGHPGGYGGMSAVTASQLEDAQRLLFQHHSLLSLPRLAAGGMAGLVGQSASEAGAPLGQEGSASADASAFAVTTGTDEDSSSGASVVAIDNKIEQAMDLVKSHLMYAVREEVEVLKEQIKELIERNSQLEQENTLLKNLASPEQLAQFQAQVQASSPTSGSQTVALGAPPALPQSLPSSQGTGPTA